MCSLIFVHLNQLRVESAKIGGNTIKPKITSQYHVEVSAFSRVNTHGPSKKFELEEEEEKEDRY